MANRKVLINRHTSGSTAPKPADMYKGEIAVQHKTGEEILWTKNNDEKMVPFISCAQTISIVSGMIEGADVVYDVQKKAGEPFINVETTTGQGQTTFTLSTSGVASDADLVALSAGTVSKFDNVANILSALTDVVVTGITGDSIITATIDEHSTSSNTYSITHKQAPAAVALGFNKLATDAYGHVTGHTAVATSDIEALGFKTSAETSEDIKALSASVVTNKANIEALSAGTLHLSADTHNKIESVYDSATTYADDAIAAAIDGLDSSKTTADNKHYITAITIADGKLSTIGEAEIPVLASAVTGTGNVVTDIAVNDHTITFAKGLTVASDTDLKAVSGIVDTFSAATMAEFNSVFTAIQAMDKDADAVDGKVVTTVSEADGVVSETKANVKDLQLGGYSKNAAATGAIAGTDTINTALSKLENQVGANKITNADGSIVVTEPAGTATTTDVKVNIKSGEKVIKLDGERGGLYTNLNLVKITESLPATVKERYEFRDSDNNKIGESIDIAKDSHIVSITYNETTQKLIYTYLDASGATQTAEVDMAHLILETEVENGIQSVNGKLSIKLDTTGDDTGDGKFLTVGTDGLKLDGVTDAIKAAVNGLNYADTAVAGQYVTEVDETNGIISVERANVSDAVLNGYAKGEKPASTAIAATDDVKGAIAKLEHQVDAAKAAATTKVVKGTDAGNNMTIVPTTGDDNSVTYTVNLTDVASKAALDAEIAARKAVDGQDGQTYAANTGATYITGATSLNDADMKLDTALKAVADQVGNLDYTGVTNENTKVVTDVKQENGLVSASATTVGDLVITAITTAGTKVAANDNLATIAGKLQGQIDAMDSTGQTTGNGYFLTSVQIADGKITAATQNDKVNSASTAAHADAAAKVDSALKLTDVAGTNNVVFDGSDNKTVTFGKAVTGVGNSMSMDANGVVDVEVIDCGEY